MPERHQDLAQRLADWYRRHGRQLPWRAGPGEAADPYRVWLSEIMLQQTTVAAVGPYYLSFLARWPTLEALAGAELDEVLHAWQGLGYYARARNLHRCAQAVVREHGGRFPAKERALRALPGIGPYTAAAVAAIAFDAKATPVDGNVERVLARLHAVETPLPDAKPALKRLAEALTPARHAGDHAQALMDLGATVCLPRRPHCERCPWQSDCRGRALGIAAELPRRRPRRARPARHGVCFWLSDGAGAVLLRRRPEAGLLGGMMEVPSTPWREAAWPDQEALAAAPLAGLDWRPVAGEVAHGFTHFSLTLRLVAAEAPGRPALDGVWCRLDQLSRLALPTLTVKVVRHALDLGLGEAAPRCRGARLRPQRNASP
jgi:A/G-specific adenine glycosylase